MAARPPGFDPLPETIDDSLIDETAPPQRSPLRSALPFGSSHGQPPPAAPPARSAPPPPPSPFEEETAGPTRSPLAEAMPFRHARPSPATVAIPIPSPEDLRRLTGQAPPPPPPPQDAAARARTERAKLEQAKTVAFAMPPEPSPAASRPGSVYPPAAQAASRPGSVYPPAAQAASRPGSVYPPAAQAASRPASVYPPAVPDAGGPVAAKSTGHFGLSIEQYAALCAEVAIHPQHADAIFAKYGLPGRKERLTADAAWQDRLRADPALMQRWQSLYLHYHQHFARAAQQRRTP
ncbi:MAG: hypothetical protein R3F14_15665 [Polyangiaceae bacterium]